MNARELLIPTDGLEQECAMCGYTWVAEEKHYKDCKVPALLVQWDAMQKVCDAASSVVLNEGEFPVANLAHKLNELELLLSELDKTKGE